MVGKKECLRRGPLVSLCCSNGLYFVVWVLRAFFFFPYRRLYHITYDNSVFCKFHHTKKMMLSSAKAG